MAVPRFFTGTTAGRMEDIRSLRGTQAVRQVGRALGSGAMGATQGSTAAAAWLDAHPVHTYDRDRQRFYEALAQGTDIMKTAVMREQYIANRNLQRLRAAAGLASTKLSEEGANARKASDIDLAVATNVGGALADEAGQKADLMSGDTPGFSDKFDRYLESEGIDPSASGSGRRRTGGGGGSTTLTGGMITVLGRQFSSVNALYPEGIALNDQGVASVKAVLANLDSGGMALVDGMNNPITSASSRAAHVIQALMPNATPQDRAKLAQAVTGEDLEAALNNARQVLTVPSSLYVSEVDKLTEEAGVRHATLIRSQAGAGSGGSGGSQSAADTARRVLLGSSETELQQLYRDQEYTEAQQRAVNTERNAAYDKAANIVAETLQGVVTTDEAGYVQLAAAVSQITRVAEATGLNFEDLWNKARSFSPNDGIKTLDWTRAVELTNEIKSAQTRADFDAVIQAYQNVRRPDVDTSEMDDISRQLLEGRETVRRDAGAAQEATRQVVGVDANTGSEPNAEAAESYAGGAADGAKGEVEGAQQQQQAQAPETPTFRPDETVTYYGLEIPASQLPDPTDYGAQVEFMWKAASSYPAHPPLQQAIRDQMSSPEFKEWMDSRGYVGNPTPQLFREFQREYRNVRRMNAIHNRRQAKMRRLAEGRLGDRETPELVKPGEEEGRTEDDAFTRRRTAEYRRQTGDQLREARRTARGDTQQPTSRDTQTVAERIRQRAQQRRPKPITDRDRALDAAGQGLPNGE